MKPIAYSVVDLYGQRHGITPILFLVFPQGKDGQEILVPLLQVQMKALKILPRDHGHIKAIFGGVGFCLPFVDMPKPIHIVLVVF